MNHWANSPKADRCDHRSALCSHEAHTVDGRDLCLYHWCEIRCAYECAEILERCLDAVRAEVEFFEQRKRHELARNTARVAEFLADQMIELRERIEKPGRDIPTLKSTWTIEEHAPGRIISSKKVAAIKAPEPTHSFNHPLVGWSRRQGGPKARVRDNEKLR